MNKTVLRSLALVTLLVAGTAHAQQDRAAERNARRFQMQLQGLQQQLQQAQADKTKVEADKTKTEAERTELAKKLQEREQAVARSSAAQRAAADKIKAVEAERDALNAKLADLQKALDDEKRAGQQALAGKDREIAQANARIKSGDDAQQEWKGRFGDQVRLVTECTEKNDRLVRLGGELIDRYRGKTVADALKQRDPLIGLSDVQLFNQVQEFRDRADAERFTPTVERR